MAQIALGATLRNLPFLGTCLGPKITQEPDQKPAFSFCPDIQSLTTVKFTFLTSLDLSHSLCQHLSPGLL